MFVQGAHGTIKVNIALPSEEPESNIILLENAEVIIRFKRKNTQFDKECIVIDAVLGEAMCYLTPDDLNQNGNYEYQVIVTYANGKIIKSAINSFYVQPSLLNMDIIN